MQENKHDEERDILTMLFSFKGRINRKEYFIYGIIIPIILIALGFFIQQVMVQSSSFLVLLVVAVLIQLATSVKRARDRDESIIALVILLLIPYISVLVILYLLFAPSKEPSTEGKKKSRVILYILLGILLLLVGGIALFLMQNSKKNSAMEKLTCVQMQSIVFSLEEYKMDNYSYPQTEEGLLSLVPYYLHRIPTDAWGNRIEYLSHVDGFELFSYGSDKVKSDDDIFLSKCQGEKK
jgi:general secretion pathway protein G